MKGEKKLRDLITKCFIIKIRKYQSLMPNSHQNIDKNRTELTHVILP